MNTQQFSEYAQKYNVSLSEAIGDRDWPMTEDQCVGAFIAVTRRMPTSSDIIQMRPDSQTAIEDDIWWNS